MGSGKEEKKKINQHRLEREVEAEEKEKRNSLRKRKVAEIL
jgi:hypothetical protein